ncbi:3',5'-cyclic AMP phosphodiesterase CpdA [Novosphingobium sp. PhB165]|uniref:phosphodiesterase n=1 Tax=Novosphingobium sp. PhB165 TaxID=2485105 RepID=UPI001053409A|nr:phosphodiesterase [Novosphingobium sp. PhB165]TCM19659.1 3',5'-cyclic AMP phosphodiesterase CpdA [Novosphingobium sp. PhB165]
MLIAQVTDIHIGFDRGNPEEFNVRRLLAVLRRIAEGPQRPDLLLLSGDLTEHGDAESYALLARLVEGCPIPVAPMTGNHDLRGPLLAAFPTCPSHDGFVQYAIELKGLRVLVLDTLEEGRHGGGFCETRAAWLSAQLAGHPHAPTVIALHHPPFESGIAWLDCDAREPWIARLAQALEGRRQVVGLLAGHLHRPIHTLWNGIPATVCGSSAAPVALDFTPADPAHPDKRAMITDEPPVYALHRWDGERLISHMEQGGEIDVLARFDAAFQPIVQAIAAERPE